MIPITELKLGERVVLSTNHRSEPLPALFEGLFADEHQAFLSEPGLSIVVGVRGFLPGAGSVAKFRIFDMHGIFRVVPDGTMRDDVGHVISVIERLTVAGHG